jgi:hypothetical protein
MTTPRFIAEAVACALAVVLMFLAWAWPALAHEATNIQGQPLGIPYPISCCSLQDCRPTLDGEVKETREGYLLVSTGELVPHGDKRIKPFAADGKIHVCQVAGNFKSGRVLCLLVPPPSF